MATKGSGAVLSVATAVSGTAVSATAITKANPAVVTATNTYSAGDVVTSSGIVGMTQLNNRAFVVTAPSGTQFTLKGEDSTNDSVYVSGGSFQKQTMAAIATVQSIGGFDGQAAEIDVTSLSSTAKEFLLGLQDFGQVTIKVLLTNGDAGQAQLRTIQRTQAPTAFTLQLSDGSISAFIALVKQFSFEGVQPDGAVSGSVTLRVTNAPPWFA
ncbi:MAG TPA: ubiquitin-activating E1 FCCH domain-containing protein [Steroidobacteraceae bacterium]|nr:ubiquitin-activating E1 FCCH domain-containing protein [Steroidobacteraceae bacterium]